MPYQGDQSSNLAREAAYCLLILAVYTAAVATGCYYLFMKQQKIERLRVAADSADAEHVGADPQRLREELKTEPVADKAAAQRGPGAALSHLQVFTTSQGSKAHLDASCRSLLQSTAKPPRAWQFCSICSDGRLTRQFED